MVERFNKTNPTKFLSVKLLIVFYPSCFFSICCDCSSSHNKIELRNKKNDFKLCSLTRGLDPFKMLGTIESTRNKTGSCMLPT